MSDGRGSGARVLDAVGVIARLVVGLQFVHMGLHKVADPVEFLKLVREYQVLDSPSLLNLVAIVLPWFEVFCGILLAAGVGLRGAAVVALAMLVPFTWLVGQRALGIQEASGIPFCSVQFDCGCGGGVVRICAKLQENAVLILLSTWVLVAPRPAWCLRSRLLRGRAPA